MTEHERAELIQKIAGDFLKENETKHIGKTNERIAVEMLGIFAGAMAILLSQGMTPANLLAAFQQLLGDMTK